MPQYCVFVNKSDVATVAPIVATGGAWPGSLVTSPRLYKHNTISYDLNQEGVYKFSVPVQNTTNMVIYNGDVTKLIESLTYLIAYGTADTYKSIAQLNSMALTSRPHMLCEAASRWVQFWLNVYAIPSRIVRVLRADAPNGFYDGHVMIEVKIDGEWKLFDPSVNFKFAGSLKDLCPVVDNSVFETLHGLKALNPSEPMVNNVYHHSSAIDMFLYSPEATKDFQRNIMQIPGIDHADGNTYFYLPAGTESRYSWVTGLSTKFKIVTKASWEGMFYP